MPKDISSSSEDEADTTGVESAPKPTESGKLTRRRCTKLV